MTTETKINGMFAILFAVMALTCLAGAAFWGAWWHLYTFLICAGLTYIFIVARDDDGDSVWKWLRRQFDEYGDGQEYDLEEEL